MTQRLVLVEGPDDVAALCELSARLFACSPEGRSASGAPRVERDVVRVTPGRVRVQLRAALNAKDGIPKALVAAFGSFGPQIESDEACIDRVAFLYDPDGDRPGAFVDRVHAELQTLQTGTTPWKVTREPGGESWTLERASEAPVSLRGIAWTADGPVPGGLDDLHNLERLLCRVMGAAYPDQEPRVVAWLTEIRAARVSLGLKAPKWKAAVLLWAALVDEAATGDAGIASRFLGQHKRKGCDDFFATYVAPQVEGAGLRESLAWIFG